MAQTNLRTVFNELHSKDLDHLSLDSLDDNSVDLMDQDDHEGEEEEDGLNQGTILLDSVQPKLSAKKLINILEELDQDSTPLLDEDAAMHRTKKINPSNSQQQVWNQTLEQLAQNLDLDETNEDWDIDEFDLDHMTTKLQPDSNASKLHQHHSIQSIPLPVNSICATSCLQSISFELQDSQFISKVGFPKLIKASEKSLFAVGTSYGLILIYNSTTQKRIAILGSILLFASNHKRASVSSLDFSSLESHLLLAGYSNGTIILWNLQTLTPIQIVRGEFSLPIHTVSFLPNNNSVVCMDVQGNTKIFLLSKNVVSQQWSLQMQFIEEGLLDLISPLQQHLEEDVHSKYTLDLKCLPQGEGSSDLNQYSIAALTVLNQIHIFTLLPKFYLIATIPIPKQNQNCCVAWMRSIIPDGMYSNVQEIPKAKKPILAIAYDNTVQIRELYTLGSQPYQIELMDPIETSVSFTVANMIWISRQVLLVQSTQKNQVAIIDPYVGKQMETVAHISMPTFFSIDYIPLYSSASSSSSSSFKKKTYPHGKIIIEHDNCNSILLLTTTQELHVLSVKNWEQRLDSFLENQQFTAALDFIVECFHGGGTCIIGLFYEGNQRKQILPDSIFKVIQSFLQAKGKECIPNCLEYILQTNDMKLLEQVLEYLLSNFGSELVWNELSPFILKDRVTHLCSIKLFDNFVLYYKTKKMRLDLLEECLLHLHWNSTTKEVIPFEHVYNTCVAPYLQLDHLLRFMVTIFNTMKQDYITPIKLLLSSSSSSTPTTPRSSPNTNEYEAIYSLNNKRMLILFEYFSNIMQGKSYCNTHSIRYEVAKASLLEWICSPCQTYQVITNRSFPIGTWQRLEAMMKRDLQKTLMQIVLVCFRDDSPTNPFDNSKSISRELLCRAILVMTCDNKKSKFFLETNNSTSNKTIMLWKPQELMYMYWFLAESLNEMKQSVSWIDDCLLIRMITFIVSIEKENKLTKQECVRKLLIKYYTLLSPQDVLKMISLLEEYQYLSACIILHESLFHYDDTIRCYLQDTHLQSHVMEYMERVMKQGDAVQLMKQAIFDNLLELLLLQPKQMTLLLVQYFPMQHRQIMQALKESNNNELLFNYLHTIMEWNDQHTLANQHQMEVTEMDKNVSMIVKEWDEEVMVQYVTLQCQYAPNQVLEFIKTHSFVNKLDDIIHVCQEYHIQDAISFCLEIKGEFVKALDYFCYQFDTSLQSLKQELVNTTFTTQVMQMKQIKELESQLDIAVEMCQRCSMRKTLDETEIENLWFSLGDYFHKPYKASRLAMSQNSKTIEQSVQSELLKLDELIEKKKEASIKLQESLIKTEQKLKLMEQDEDNDEDALENVKAQISRRKEGISQLLLEISQIEASKVQTIQVLEKQKQDPLAITNLPKQTIQILQQVLLYMISKINYAMIGFVALPSMLTKLMNDYKRDPFGQIKSNLFKLLSLYDFHHIVLENADTILKSDTFKTCQEYSKQLARAKKPIYMSCQLCRQPLSNSGSTNEEDDEAEDAIRLFDCGHAYHIHCLPSKYKLTCPVDNRQAKMNTIAQQYTQQAEPQLPQNIKQSSKLEAMQAVNDALTSESKIYLYRNMLESTHFLSTELSSTTTNLAKSLVDENVRKVVFVEPLQLAPKNLADNELVQNMNMTREIGMIKHSEATNLMKPPKPINIVQVIQQFPSLEE